MGLRFEITSVAVLSIKGVVEAALERVHAFGSGIDGELGVFAYGEAAQVVKADDVIGVLVGVEHGVEVLDFFTQALCAKIRAGIDDPFHVGGLNMDGSSEAIVFWVVGFAHWAVAADDGDSDGGGGAEEGDFKIRHAGKWCGGSVFDFHKFDT